MQRLHDINITVPEPSVIVNNSDSIWPNAIGAFLGAFFAFSFGLVAFYLQKKFERYWKHKNVIVEIEHLLNDHLNNTADNRFLLKGAVKTLKKHHMTYTILKQFRLPEDVSIRIGNLDALNRYASYKSSVEKLNGSMNTWQGMNERFQQQAIANPNIPTDIIHKNMDFLQDNAEALIKFLNGLDEETKELLSYVRILLRKDKHIWSLWFLEKKFNSTSIITDKEIARELKKLETEVGEISQQSRERINKITKN